MTTQPVRVLLNVEEAHRALSISRGQLYKLMAAGEITATKIGSRTLFSVTELERFARECSQPEKQAKK